MPAWIDAPPGTLTDTEREALVAAKHAFAWHLDFAPTVLDLLGITDAPPLSPFRARMTGTSLLRKDRTQGILPLTNCTDTWGCGFRNWGVMKRTLKLEAQEFDSAWRCYDVMADPSERRDLGGDGCPELRRAAEGFFGKLPKDTGEMRGMAP